MPQATLDFRYDGPKRVFYAYDSNGNITCDPLRCFEIRYNLLNLASEVIGHDPEDTAAEGTLLCETVYYADGTRSGVRLPDDGLWLTRYVSSLICDGDSEFLYPMGVVSDFGYIDLQSGKMQYFLRDHLGSVRVIAEDRHTVISRTDYLPFGVRMSGDGLTVGNPSARSSFFGFSGKENEMWGGYDTADGDITPHWLKGERYQHFGARAYDPVSCIFMQVDPMAEKYYGMTPYHYCAGNPVMIVDQDGRELYAKGASQTLLLQDIRLLFGDKASHFKFDDNKLVLETSAKEFKNKMSRNQKRAFKILYSAMSDSQKTEVFYTDQISLKPMEIGVDVNKDFGGGLYSLEDNVIAISPNPKYVEIIEVKEFAGMPVLGETISVRQNTASILFHELGERQTSDIHFRGKVIDIENIARELLGLPKRPYDLNHNDIIPTNYK